jgi:soluble lytic murein transglycosylase
LVILLTKMRTLVALACLGLLAAPLSARAQPDAALKQAIAKVKEAEGTEALALADKVADPAGKALVTWLAIRQTPKDVGYERAARFLRERPEWPGQTVLRRRVEKLLYDEDKDAKIVRAFFAGARPVSGEGKIALAKALKAAGDQSGALTLAKSAWREDDLTKDAETDLLDSFPNALTRADHKARADKMFAIAAYDDAERAYDRAGPEFAALGRARAAVQQKAGNAQKLLDAVPAGVRSDSGYKLARVQHLRRKDDHAGAARLLTEGPRPVAGPDADLWWLERRMLVRQLLDNDQPKLAYRIAGEAATPLSENYKADQQFTAGWVALRFLNDPASARRHFAEIPKISVHPLTLARGYYWLGRTAEAANDPVGARTQYEYAAAHPVAYYGQLARARLKLSDLALRRLPQPTDAERAAFERQEPTRALRLLYAVGAADLAVPIYIDLVERARDQITVVMLADIATEMRDARGLVIITKTALNRGLPLEGIGFPTFALPAFNHVGPAVDRSVLYAIARQESQFDPKAVSVANAQGLMQVMPATGKAIAKKFGLAFDKNRMREPTFSLQLGAAELGDLLQAYRGSYVLTFIGYNAGRGRARQWIEKYGDPRDPKVDAVDWVERIPISETRFYIQRVMENMQVYRALLGAKPALTIEADLVRGRMN